MLRFIRYYGQYQDIRGRFGGLPGWGRFLVFLAAVPGIILGLLSLLALAVSILALLLLTVPVYRVLSAITGGGGEMEPEPDVTVSSSPPEDIIDAEVVQPVEKPRRQIDVRIVD